MNGKWRVLSALLVVFALMVAGCGSSTPPISIALSLASPQNAIAGQALNITATVSNDSKAAGVTWSLSGPGALTAQTTTSVTYTAPSPITSSGTATITATSISNTTKVAALTINLQAVTISLSPSATQTDEQTQSTAVTASVSNDPTTGGVTWSLNAGAKGTLSGQTATGVTYKAPASVTAASTDTITATSNFDNTKTATLSINLVPPPSVTTASLPAGTVSSAYSTTVAATGGVTPYTWSWTAQAGSSLPPGLTISSSGTISGTPTQFGTFNVAVQVKDANNFTASANLSLKINPAPVAITTTSLPNGVVNTAYSATLQATGGAPPITWSITAGALPTGLALNTATGAITGTPTTAGASNFTVQAADSSTPALTATKALSITIIPTLTITTTSLPNGITSTAYSASVASTGGSGAVTWSVTVGSLPAGLSLNASTGAITGTPTTAGTSNFTVQAVDSGTPQQTTTKALSITIVQQLVINNSSLPTGAVNSTYSATLTSSGGTAPVTWSVSAGTLPAGLTLNAATGTITGTPTTAGTSMFTIMATDSGTPQQTPTKQFTIIINPILSIATTSLPSGTVGTAYSQTLQTNGGGIPPITWTVTLGSLPPGLTLSSGGVISGTPTTATGSPFNFTVQAADSGTPQQTATQALSISIATAPLSVATTGLPNGVVGQAYTGAQLQSAGGNPPVTWSISSGSLPSWASLNAATGAITGTPNATGTSTFTVKATDSTTPTPQTATKQLSITVVNALSITTLSLPNGTVGSAYSSTVAATGGTTPYTWSWVAQAGSSLPPGLSIDSSTGVISGTPSTNTGSPFNVTVSVADSGSPQLNASANFSITITVATLTVTTTSSNLPTGTVNTAYQNAQLNASGGIPPYTWAQTGGTLPPGLTLSTSGAISGTPTTATGSPFSFTVTVTDSAVPANTANGNLSITVNVAAACTTSGGSESLLSGQYAFVLKGFDNGTGAGETAREPALVGGVLTFNGTDNGGLITAGAIDMNLNSGVQTNLTVTSGTYGVGSDHRGCMAITTSGGTQHYAFSVGNISGGVASTAHVINFDAAGPFTTGTMRKQTTTAFNTTQVTGNYAFGVSSVQNTAACNNGPCGGNFGAVGVFNMSTGTVTGGEVDFNNSGFLDGSNTAGGNWPASAGSFTSGSYSISSTNGRGTLTFTPTGAGAAVNTVIYVVSSTEVLVLDVDSQTATTGSNTIFAGELLKQSGSLAGNPLSGNYVGYFSAPSSTAGASKTTLLLINASGSSITGNQLRNDAGSFQSNSIGSGITYSVDAQGRMVIPPSPGNNPPIFYLVSANEAFVLDPNTTADSGVFQSQSATSASGTFAFGSIDPGNANAGTSSGVVTLSSGTATGTSDNNSSGGSQLGGAISVTYSIDSTGLGTIPSGCTNSTASTTCQLVFYVVTPTRAILMELQHNNGTAQADPKIQPLDQ